MGVSDKWVDQNAGPVVRPYALTGGRTEPDGELLDLIAIVMTASRVREAGALPVDEMGVSPEHRRILTLCHNALTVADVAADTGLPIGVVRVLLADLIQQGQITVLAERATEDRPSADLLKEVLHGLRTL